MFRLMWIVVWLRDKWDAISSFAHRHHIACKRLHHGTHLCYFFMVGMHGPYHYAALALLVLGIAMWVVKLEVE